MIQGKTVRKDHAAFLFTAGTVGPVSGNLVKLQMPMDKAEGLDKPFDR